MVQDPDGEGKIVYLFLPLYQAGNLQDAINANVVNGTHFPEAEMIRLFKGTCLGVRAMHDYHAPIASSSGSGSNRQAPPTAQRPLSPPPSKGDDDEDEDDAMFPHPEGDGDEGYSYGGTVNVPLMTKHVVEEEGDVVFDGDDELPHAGNGAAVPGQTELVPYAHRDLKPG